MDQRKLQLIGAAAAASTLVILLSKKKRKDRVWSREWVKRREQLGTHHTLYRELRTEDVLEFGRYLRMTPCDFDFLLRLVKPIISKQDTQMRKSISAAERLDVTLRFLAGGGTYSNLQYSYRIPKQTLSTIVPEVCEALYKVLKGYIKIPQTEQEWEDVAEEFELKWNLPHCVGAIDGKHISLKAPAFGGSYFFNYKGFNSIVLMALVDADYKFIYIDVGCNGRISDGGVFSQCSLYTALENNALHLPQPKCFPSSTDADLNQSSSNSADETATVPFFFVGDNAFPLKPNLLKPYPNRNITKSQRVFNYRLSRARRVSENAFGILSNRFRIFMAPIQLSAEKADKIVLACCSLHNFLRSRPSRQLYTPRNLVDQDDENHAVVPGLWHQDSQNQMLPLNLQNGYNTSCEDAKNVRNRVCKYVNNKGSVPWQWQLA